MPSHLCEAAACTGCRACAELCPAQCIEMRPDGEGYLAPVVDEARCMDCGLCAARCPQTGGPVRAGETLRVFALKHPDDTVLAQCTSGGAFHALAEAVRAEGGFVYGCGFDETLRARHTEIAPDCPLTPLYGSKYVQSDTEHTYRQAKARLDAGAPVLYTGTPCQIAGLSAFLGKPYANLVTVELLCMGVPSPGLFRAYLDWREQKLKARIVRVLFRTKDVIKWGVSMAMRIETEQKTVYQPANTDPYFSSFLKGRTLRECCYRCRHREKARSGDLTICDYWGIDTQYPDFFSTRGVSGVAVNSEKGMALLEKAAGTLALRETSIESISAENTVFFRSKRRPAERDRAYAEGIRPEMFVQNPVFFPSLFDRVFTALPAFAKPMAKNLRRKWTRLRYRKPSPRKGG